MSTAQQFIYVDTATNGLHNRNKVMKLDEYHPPKGALDCFTTYLRFTEDLLNYTLENPSPETGKPSVAKYPGPAWATFIPFDFDHQVDPKKAIAEAVSYVRIWESRWNLPPEALRIYWSGMKGISIEIPAELFGGFEPSTDIATNLRALALKMAPDAKTLDTTIYEKLRLWRVPNTKHSGSGLHKIPLTVQEILDADCYDKEDCD